MTVEMGGAALRPVGLCPATPLYGAASLPLISVGTMRPAAFATNFCSGIVPSFLTPVLREDTRSDGQFDGPQGSLHHRRVDHLAAERHDTQALRVGRLRDSSLIARRLVEIAADADAADALISRCHFDLIISDWNMPNLDGYALLCRIKGDDATRQIPFLMATGQGDKAQENKALEAGVDAFKRPAKKADGVLENFRPGAMDRLGFGWEAMHALNPRLIYCSLKGFLPGPYEQRMALDEVVQIMSGLAYMTGPEGRP